MQVRAGSGVLCAVGLALVAAIACSSGSKPPERRESASPPAPQAAAPPSTGGAKATGNRRIPRIVIIGDSLTAGLGLSVDDAYPALLQQRLTAKGLSYQVINAGVSGDTSAGGLARLDWALDGDVRILLLALGGNDALRGLPPEQLKENLSIMIERAQARGISVILAGMEAPPNWGSQYTTEFHDVYPSLSAKYHVPLIPFLLANVAGIERLNQRDGIHPTAEGDRIVADNVWTVLQRVVEQRASSKEGAPGS